jgi:predicted RNA-binding Zn-ribbon protein involved in translation (DUF1610 family)
MRKPISLPEKEVLVALLKSKPYAAVGAHFNVSADLVGLWVKHYGIGVAKKVMPPESKLLDLCTGRSDAEVGILLGTSRSNVLRWREVYGIVKGKRTSKRETYSKETLLAAAGTAISVAAVCRALGLKPSTKNHPRISKLLSFFEIDTSHFLGTRHAKISIKDWRGILVVREPLTRPSGGQILTKALIAIGVPHICSVCAMGSLWQGKPLTLEVDHINGKPWDNRPENLRFICPNCHSQTSNDGKKNSKITVTAIPVRTEKEKSPKVPIKNKRYLCADCGVESKGLRCRKCAGNHRATKIQWPSTEDLKLRLTETPASVVAKSIGVSNSAIKKHCIKHGIETPPRGYWTPKGVKIGSKK